MTLLPPLHRETSCAPEAKNRRICGALIADVARLLLPLSAVFYLSACGEDPTPPASDTAQAVDVGENDTNGAGDTTTAETDTTAAVDAIADAGPAFDCKQGCAGFAVCGAAFPTDLCEQLCGDVGTQAPAVKCLTTVADCDSLLTCMVSAAVPPKEPVRTFDESKPGTTWKTLAGDFSIPTRRGLWTFSDHYDGNHSYVFLLVGAGVFPSNPGLLTSNWTAPTTQDIKAFFNFSAENTHYFFLAYKDAGGANNTTKYMDSMLAKFENVLKTFAPLDRLKWRSRLHFATKPVPWTSQAALPPEGIGGWLGEYTNKRRPAYFAIDRFQQIRQIGLLRYVQNPKFLIQHLPLEARYYNFEYNRALAHPETKEMKIVTVYDAKKVNTETIDFDLPDAKELSGYDTVEVDLTHDCVGHDQANCFEWDYHAHLRVIGRPATEDEDKNVAASCQLKVGAVKAQEEALGTCQLAGKATETACKNHCDCEAVHGVGATCKGYKPARKEAAAIPADTKDCSCIDPRGETQKRQRGCTWVSKNVVETLGSCVADGKTNYCKTCKKDDDCGGTPGACKGYKAAQKGETGWGKCGCRAHYVQRWITSYRREGRWTTNSPRARYWLANGGKVRLNYKGSYPYTVTLKFRYLNKGQPTPTGMVELFTGGGFNPSYNDKYEPQEVTVPKDAKKVELSVDVSGHGFGDKANCAEFCNHTHHFTVKSAAGEKTYVKEHPKAGKLYGCAEQIDEGTVPNQFGTWYLGRAGWCPGKDVKVVSWDISDQVKPGEKFTVTYKGLYAGKDYKSEPGNGGGFGARIDMTSWVLFYE